MKQSMLYPRASAARRVTDLGGMWKFCLDWDGKGDQEGWKDGIPGTEKIPVPASFNDFYTDKDIVSLPEISGMRRKCLFPVSGGKCMWIFGLRR